MRSENLKKGKLNNYYFSFFRGFYFFSVGYFAYKKIDINLPIRRWQQKCVSLA